MVTPRATVGGPAGSELETPGVFANPRQVRRLSADQMSVAFGASGQPHRREHQAPWSAQEQRPAGFIAARRQFQPLEAVEQVEMRLVNSSFASGAPRQK